MAASCNRAICRKVRRSRIMATLNDGQHFERYRVIRFLGSGISGESYEAEDTVLQRRVTLKLIHPWGRIADAALRQFFREMQGMSTITHPYIAATLDYGELEGKLYMARRFVSAGSLLNNEGRAWFRPPLAITDALTYIHQLAQALAHTHNHGYVHGALTLSNILVLRGPNLDKEHDYAPFLIADSGLSHFIRRFGQPRVTHFPITAAPEQFGGRVTAASDQYALAIIAYFWLAGSLPFLGSSEEVEQMKLTETIVPLTTLNPHVQTLQENIIRRALSVYPDERFPSILAFTNALQATLTTSPLTTMQDLSVPPEIVAQITPNPNQPPMPDIPDVPQPRPLPEQEPQPLPEPGPAPVPEPSPEPRPEPEILPQPEPDIPSPLPDPQRGPVPEPNQPQAESTVLPAASLLITVPNTKEKRTFQLLQAEATIGHAGSSDILLDQDDSTSRHHALIRREGTNYVLYDQRSTNGVIVNGQKLAPETGYTLTDGDSIMIGAYQLTFHTINAASEHRLQALYQQ